MKKILTTLSLCIAILSNAQVTEKEDALKSVDTLSTDGWKKSGYFGIGIGQVALSNWAGGGVNSISLSGLLNLSANYKKDKFYWNNEGVFAFGIINQDKSALWIKNDDKIDVTSKAGKVIKKGTSFAGLFNFRTQFAQGFEDEAQLKMISKFAAPAYSILAVGFDFQPLTSLSIFVAPITLKTTYVADQFLADAGAYGVEGATYSDAGVLLESGKLLRNEMGGYMKIAYNKSFTKSVALGTKLDLFSNYLSNPQNIDVNWEALLTIKAGKYITTTISTQILYDDDVDIAIDTNDDGVTDKRGPRLQFREALSVGFSVNF